MELNKKGLIFSTDAFFGLVIVVILAGALSVYYIGEDTNPKFNETLNYKTTDKALVAFYLGGQPPADPGNASHKQCETIYDYGFTQNDTQAQQQSPITEKKFCEKI